MNIEEPIQPPKPRRKSGSMRHRDQYRAIRNAIRKHAMPVPNDGSKEIYFFPTGRYTTITFTEEQWEQWEQLSVGEPETDDID